MELREMEERENGVVLPERKTKIKTRKNRRKLKEEEEEAEELLQDPLDVFGKDIMLKILKSLNEHSMTLSLLVSRAWNGIACSDMLWTSKKLWFGKAHIPRLSLIQGLPKLAAYSLSVMNGKCVAPEYWLNLDRYWKGTSPLMHRYFHEDGSQTADPGDKVWGGHECCYSIVTSVVGEEKIWEHYVRINCRLPHIFI